MPGARAVGEDGIGAVGLVRAAAGGGGREAPRCCCYHALLCETPLTRLLQTLVGEMFVLARRVWTHLIDECLVARSVVRCAACKKRVDAGHGSCVCTRRATSSKRLHACMHALPHARLLLLVVCQEEGASTACARGMLENCTHAPPRTCAICNARLRLRACCMLHACCMLRACLHVLNAGGSASRGTRLMLTPDFMPHVCPHILGCNMRHKDFMPHVCPHVLGCKDRQSHVGCDSMPHVCPFAFANVNTHAHTHTRQVVPGDSWELHVVGSSK